jgi:hypothetical protein
VCAGVASAVDDDPDKDPPPSAGAPNLLFTANSVEPFGTSQVRAVSFRAIDESGPDSPGSNRPYWILSTVGKDGTARTRASHVFGSIDTGDSASFGVTEGCTYLSCAGGAAPFGIGFSIQLWEQDNNDLAKVLQEISEQFPKAGALSSTVSAPTWAGTALPLVGGILDVLADLAKDDLLGVADVRVQPRLPGGEAADGGHDLHRQAALRGRERDPRRRLRADDNRDASRLMSSTEDTAAAAASVSSTR